MYSHRNRGRSHPGAGFTSPRAYTTVSTGSVYARVGRSGNQSVGDGNSTLSPNGRRHGEQEGEGRDG